MSSKAKKTPRSSERLRTKSNKKFQFPSREERWSDIPSNISPRQSLREFKPRKLVNDFTRERNTYNKEKIYSDEEDGDSMDDFIADDVEPVESEENNDSDDNNDDKASPKRRRRDSRVISSSSDEKSNDSTGSVDSDHVQVSTSGKKRQIIDSSDSEDTRDYDYDVIATDGTSTNEKDPDNNDQESNTHTQAITNDNSVGDENGNDEEEIQTPKQKNLSNVIYDSDDDVSDDTEKENSNPEGRTQVVETLQIEDVAHGNDDNSVSEVNGDESKVLTSRVEQNSTAGNSEHENSSSSSSEYSDSETSSSRESSDDFMDESGDETYSKGKRAKARSRKNEHEKQRLFEALKNERKRKLSMDGR